MTTNNTKLDDLILALPVGDTVKQEVAQVADDTRDPLVVAFMAIFGSVVMQQESVVTSG